MELYDYYSLDECVDRKLVTGTLKSFKKDGKIDYSLDGEILNIKDLDMEEEDIAYLEELFEDNDVFPYLEKDDEDDDDNYYGYDEEDDY